MITSIRYIMAEGTNPYQNLALEAYLTFHVREGECILYLWQNRQTVVIGKNQNCWKECKVNALESDSGFLVRRMSGGGAVFHDLGNLNFTFCVRKADYDVDRQLEVIVKAVADLGMEARKTGRNDITIEGRKFSGNAFFESGAFAYHHGTILVNVDKTEMSRYLNVDKEKLASKSVESVKARVANLTEFNSDVTIEKVCKSLIGAFSEVYGLNAEPYETERLSADDIKKGETVFSSWDWKYGRKIPFTYEMTKRYPWGNIELQLAVNEGRIYETNVFSDAMDQEFVLQMAEKLKNCNYQIEEMIHALRTLKQKSEVQKQMINDTAELIREKF